MKNLNTRFLRFTKLLEFSVALCLMVAIVIAAGMALLDTTALVIAGDFQLEHFLSGVLTIVVAIEFVKMLLLHTPESVIEVLLYAVARQIIISHESAMENLIGVLAVAIIFIIRKYFSKSFLSAVGDE